MLSTKAKFAFEELKQMFLKVSILCHFNQKHSIKVETDVFEFAISAILIQCKKDKEFEQH